MDNKIEATSQKGNKHSYTISLNINAIRFAESNGNLAAGKKNLMMILRE